MVRKSHRFIHGMRFKICFLSLVVIYRCREMADDCGACLSLPKKYNCGWCRPASGCELDSQCRKSDEMSDDWLNHAQMCPIPSIDSVLSGPPGKFNAVRGIPSGGIKIHVTGNDLKSLRTPSMYVYSNNAVNSSVCEVMSDREMLCLLPGIDIGNMTFNVDTPLILRYEFRENSMNGTRRVTMHLSDLFELYPDPVYYPFENGVKYFKSDVLILNGENLHLACTEDEVMVEIGDGICRITSLSRHQLTCYPPSDMKG